LVPENQDVVALKNFWAKDLLHVVKFESNFLIRLSITN
jgi:hypothetical protein